jgi:hypothetical protein
MKLGKALLVAALALGAGSGAQAYTTHVGTIHVNHVWGTYLRGGDAHGDWTGAGYGYSMPSTIGFAAGNTIYDSANGAALNGSWVQEAEGGNGQWLGQGTMWDLGFASTTVDVFPFIDHVGDGETAVQEGTEFRVWGSNDLVNWFQGSWTDSWTDGYNAAAIYDDYTSRWAFGDAYRYVGIVAGNGEVDYYSGDAEIDAVGVAQPVPEPKSLLLIGASLIGIGAVFAGKRIAA